MRKTVQSTFFLKKSVLSHGQFSFPFSMAYVPSRIIVLKFFFTAVLVNCPRDIVGEERDLFEYADLDTEPSIQPRTGDADIIDSRDFGNFEDDSREAATKPFYCLGQGKHMLFFVPGVKHCGLLSYQIWNENWEEWTNLGCSEAPVIGWMWAFEVVPDQLNKYRVYGKLNLRPILIGEAIVLLAQPPPIKSHLVSVGPGWVSIWIKLPVEDQPNLLGVYVRFIDEEWSLSDDVTNKLEVWNKTIYHNKKFFENVKYAGKKAMLWPIHNCPYWPSSGMYCMLFTDKFTYTQEWRKGHQKSNKIEGWGAEKSTPVPSQGSNKTIFFLMTTYRIPRYFPVSVYSARYNVVVDHVDCDPYEDCPRLTGKLAVGAEGQLDDMIMPPMFDDQAPRRKPVQKYWPRENQLWVIFIVLSLFVLAVILPIILYFATRAGYRAADDMWTSWAEAPGNIIVGLGYTTVAWQGQQPAWKYEPRGG